MLLSDLAMLLVSIGALWSLRRMGEPFQNLEKIVLYLACVVAFEQAHSAVADNLKLLRISASAGAFGFLKMSQLIVFPAATMWLLYSFFRIRDRLLLKVVLGAAWMAGLTAAIEWARAIGAMKGTGGIPGMRCSPGHSCCWGPWSSPRGSASCSENGGKPMLYVPERFDLNEWFDLISAALPLTIALLLPGRFTRIALAVLTVFSVFMAQTVDSLIAVQPYDLYDVDDNSEFEVADILSYYFSYSPTTYLFSYFYDKWGLKGWCRAAYVLLWACLSWALEWAAYRCHVFHYKGWKPVYSPFAYLVIYGLFIVMFHAIQNVMNREGIPMRRSDLGRPGGS